MKTNEYQLLKSNLHPYEFNTTYDQVYCLVVVGLLLPLFQLVGWQIRYQFVTLLQGLLFFWIPQERTIRLPRADCPPFIFCLDRAKFVSGHIQLITGGQYAYPLWTVRWCPTASLTIAPVTMCRVIRCPSGPFAASGRTVRLTRTFSAKPLTKVSGHLQTVPLIPADSPL